MAEVTRSASRSVHISSQPPVTGGMSVWALRDFVRTLDAEQIPDDARVQYHRADDTMHLVRLSVRVTIPLDGTDGGEQP